MTLPTSFQSAFSSLFQSAVKSAVHIASEAATPVAGLMAEHGMMQSVTKVLQAHEKGQNLDSFHGTASECASLALQYALAKSAGDNNKAAQIDAQLRMGTCDPLWLTSMATFFEYYSQAKKPIYKVHQNVNDFTYAMPEGGLIIGLLADWGTGDKIVAKAGLTELVTKYKPDLIIHLGDIYYAGTIDECRNNFLAFIQEVREETGINFPVYNIPGNHDYYSGGTGFYDILPDINKGVPTGSIQGGSYFCLKNSRWQLEGLDTGYNDHDLLKVDDDITELLPSEVAFHRNRLGDARDHGRNVIMFSHHQVMSAFQNIGKKGSANNYYNPNLTQPFDDFLNSEVISAWFWGHEHLLEIYQNFTTPGDHPVTVKNGRCIGYSAFPVLNDPNPYIRVQPQNVVPLVPGTAPGQDFIQLGTMQDVHNHGFVVLTLSGDDLSADYYQTPGDGSTSEAVLVYGESMTAVKP